MFYILRTAELFSKPNWDTKELKKFTVTADHWSVVCLFCHQSLAIVENDFDVKVAVLDLLQKLTQDSGAFLQSDLHPKLAYVYFSVN